MLAAELGLRPGPRAQIVGDIKHGLAAAGAPSIPPSSTPRPSSSTSRRPSPSSCRRRLARRLPRRGGRR